MAVSVKGTFLVLQPALDFGNPPDFLGDPARLDVAPEASLFVALVVLICLNLDHIFTSYMSFLYRAIKTPLLLQPWTMSLFFCFLFVLLSTAVALL